MMDSRTAFVDTQEDGNDHLQLNIEQCSHY